MPIPESLQHQIDLFRATRRVALLDPDGFTEPSYVAMLIGLRVMPQQYDLLVDHLDLRQLHVHLAGLRDAIRQAVRGMPLQDDYLARQVPPGTAWAARQRLAGQLTQYRVSDGTPHDQPIFVVMAVVDAAVQA